MLEPTLKRPVEILSYRLILSGEKQLNSKKYLIFFGSDLGLITYLYDEFGFQHLTITIHVENLCLQSSDIYL